jgi:DNA-binding transcriptional LysR family regulator
MTDPDRWGALEVRHLRAFVSVVDEGSFAAAARALGYTQSGISQQIFALERIAGGPLLTRHAGGRRPPELTAAGALALAHARALLARISVTQADLDALGAGAAGELSVVTIQSIGARILPAVLARFRVLQPAVHVHIAEAFAMDPLLSAVEHGDADIGFAPMPIGDGPFEVRRLLSDPYVLVTRNDRTERELEDLDGKRLLGIRGCRHDKLVEQRLLAQGVVPAAVERFDDNGIIQALVAAGEGVAVVPQLTVDLTDQRLVAHPLDELPPRELIAVTHRDRRPIPAVSSFLEVATEACATPEAAGSRP